MASFNLNLFAGSPAAGEPARAQGARHVAYRDMRVPGFCRASGTHLFLERRGPQASFFYPCGGYSLQNLDFLYDLEIFPTFLVEEALIVLCFL